MFWPTEWLPASQKDPPLSSQCNIIISASALALGATGPATVDVALSKRLRTDKAVLSQQVARSQILTSRFDHKHLASQTSSRSLEGLRNRKVSSPQLSVNSLLYRAPRFCAVLFRHCHPYERIPRHRTPSETKSIPHSSHTDCISLS